MRPLPVGPVGDGRWVVADLDGATRLAIGAVADRAELTAVAAPSGGASGAISRSVVDGRLAVIAARAGRVGVDVETIARVALNASPQDRWLACGERALVDRAADQVLELACHWVLKEAYGKALGVGLALPLDLLGFGGRGRAIVLDGAAAPSRRERWAFGLYRYADVILGVARRAEP